MFFIFFLQAEDGIRDADVTGVQTCALPISPSTFFAVVAIAITAKKVDGGYLINGAKQLITNGGIADLHVIFDNTRSEERREGHVFIPHRRTEEGRVGNDDTTTERNSAHTRR